MTDPYAFVKTHFENVTGVTVNAGKRVSALRPEGGEEGA